MDKPKPDAPPRYEPVPQSEIEIAFVERTGEGGRRYLLAKPRLPVSIDLANAALFFWIDDVPPKLTARIERPRRAERENGEDGEPERKPRMVDWGD